MTTPFMLTIDCPWCSGSGRTECNTLRCSDPDHGGECRYCKGTGEVAAAPRGGRYLIKVPVWSVPSTIVWNDGTGWRSGPPGADIPQHLLREAWKRWDAAKPREEVSNDRSCTQGCEYICRCF